MAVDEEDEPVKIKTKRKVKKAIPVGSNGRPKKRTVQSQTKMEGGYMGEFACLVLSWCEEMLNAFVLCSH